MVNALDNTKLYAYTTQAFLFIDETESTFIPRGVIGEIVYFEHSHDNTFCDVKLSENTTLYDVQLGTHIELVNLPEYLSS